MVSKHQVAMAELQETQNQTRKRYETEVETIYLRVDQIMGKVCNLKKDFMDSLSGYNVRVTNDQAGTHVS